MIRRNHQTATENTLNPLLSGGKQEDAFLEAQAGAGFPSLASAPHNITAPHDGISGTSCFSRSFACLALDLSLERPQPLSVEPHALLETSAWHTCTVCKTAHVLHSHREVPLIIIEKHCDVSQCPATVQRLQNKDTANMPKTEHYQANSLSLVSRIENADAFCGVFFCSELFQSVSQKLLVVAG